MGFNSAFKGLKECIKKLRLTEFRHLMTSLKSPAEGVSYKLMFCCVFFTFICPFIASISLKYNQQDATFSQSIYFYKLLYMFQAVPPPIIRSTKLYIQRQVLSNQYCCLLPETCRAIYRNKWIEKTLYLVGCTLEMFCCVLTYHIKCCYYSVFHVTIMILDTNKVALTLLSNSMKRRQRRRLYYNISSSQLYSSKWQCNHAFY